MTKHARSWLLGLMGLSLALAIAGGWVMRPEAAPETPSASALEAACQPDAVQAVASAVKTTSVTVKPVPNGPFRTATRFVPAKGNVPAFCQVTGSFVTNPSTGKTANFLATLPLSWNRKYLQLGCSGMCGQFYVSDPAMASIVVTAQGFPGQIIIKGYAAFATDEGHVGMSTDWAAKGPGQVDQDAIDDLYYRADKVLSTMGKEFSVAFYARLNGAPARIQHAYFSGCSDGGHDAFVAAAHFPEAFDGIIAGSPANYVGLPFILSGIGAAMERSPDAKVSRAQFALVDAIVTRQCDALDGVKDGMIQNPAACDFRPERDLPHCQGDAPGDQCFTRAQRQTISTMISAVTDEHGRVVQPGYSVSEMQAPAATLALSNPMLKLFVHKNDPAYTPASIYTFKEGGPGPVSGFHAVVPAAEVAKSRKEMWLGTGEYPESADGLLKLDRKLLIWSNLSDGTLVPYTATNYYKQLAALHGGYAKLQKNVRLFDLPGTDHCGITGIGPNSFDPLSAMEDWVEKGKAPEALKVSVADHQFSPGAAKSVAMKSPDWTMPLCKFPEMARYRGKGDLKDGANWSCQASDARMLKVGPSGREAGVTG